MEGHKPEGGRPGALGEVQGRAVCQPFAAGSGALPNNVKQGFDDAWVEL